MTTRGGQLGPPTGPSGVDDAVLLAWVEGTATAAEAEAVRLGMIADPALALLLEGMKSDRARLELLGDLAPPPGLVEGAMARFDAMSTIDSGVLAEISGSGVHEIRVSREVPSHRRYWKRDRVLLAIAAVVAVVSGVTWWGLQPSSVSKIKGTGPIATESGVVPLPNSPNIALDPVRTLGAQPANELVEPTAVEIRMATLDKSPELPLIIAPILTDPTDRWIRAAREGRLAIVVTARRAETVESSMASLVSASGGSRPWKLSDRVPDAVKIALAKPPPPRPAAKEPAPLLVASADHAERRLPIVQSPQPTTTQPSAPSAIVCVGSFTPTASGIDSLRSALLEQVGTVSFVELDAPLVSQTEPAATTPDSVIWWTLPATRWVPWVDVPVIVER